MQAINNFLASVHYLNHPLLSGLSTLICLSLGIFVLSRDKKSNLNRIFFCAMFFISVWLFGNALSMFYVSNSKLAVFWWKFAYSGAIFIGIAFYHFYLIYSQKKKNIIHILYFISILEVIYLWFPTTNIGEFYLLPNVGLVFIKITVFSYFLIFGLIKFILLLFITAISLLGQYKKASTPLEKLQLKYLAILFFVLIMGATEWLPTFNIPLHIGWLFTPFFAGLIAYSILKYQLMDIKIIIKKTFFYSLGIALISGLIFGVSFLNSWFAGHISGFKPWMIPLISGIAAFIIGRLFWRKSKEVDKLKYEFITVAAHKLRTPLTEIKWAASSLLDAAMPEREKDKLVKGIISADERLVDLTSELLAASKTEAVRYQYDFESADLEKVARKVVNSFQFRMKEKSIKLEYSAEKNLPEVKIDKKRISSVIEALLENAILYTKDEIKINIDVYKNSVIFHIEDNGIGIPKDDQPYIFSKFYRTKDAYLTETEGTGVSLFLAKSIIDKHNGKIGVRSEGKGKGSIFWFSLPF